MTPDTQIEIFSISHNIVLETERLRVNADWEATTKEDEVEPRVIADLEVTTEELRSTADLGQCVYFVFMVHT